MHPGRKWQAGVNFSGRSLYDGAPKREGKCLQPLVLPQHPSCSHRWRATYYQQEASWHLPEIFSPPPQYHSITSLSSFASPYFPFFASSLSISASSFLKYPLIPYFSYAVSQKRTFLKWSFMLTSLCIFYSPFSNLLRAEWSEEQGGKPCSSDTAGIYLCSIFFFHSFPLFCLLKSKLNHFQHLEPFVVTRN